jgi:hypothetical protein
VFQFRVTKYNPSHRNSAGSYLRDEWTSFSDIGQSFTGVLFTEREYQRVENAYATVAVAFMQEAGVSFLTVTGLENHACLPLPFSDGAVLGPTEIDSVVRQLLRAQFWCRLESIGGFIHVGYDYYMYLGVSALCPNAEAMACKMGLFVVPFKSPYATSE